MSESNHGVRGRSSQNRELAIHLMGDFVILRERLEDLR